MEDCLFCKIVAREVKADVIREGERVVAFRDVRPRAPTHVLIIPKAHVKDVSQVGEVHGPMLAEALAVAGEIAAADGIAESGYRVVANVGPNAGQSVFHLHFHLLGGRPMGWPPG